MSPRPRKNNVSISGLYARFDRRTAKTYYQYKNPLTGKFHGLGTDREKAEKISHNGKSENCSSRSRALFAPN